MSDNQYGSPGPSGSMNNGNAGQQAGGMGMEGMAGQGQAAMGAQQAMGGQQGMGEQGMAGSGLPQGGPAPVQGQQPGAMPQGGYYHPGQMSMPQGQMGMPQGMPPMPQGMGYPGAMPPQMAYPHPGFAQPGMYVPHPMPAQPMPGMGMGAAPGQGPNMAEMMKDLSEGNTMSSLSKLLNMDDSEFWKGALIGAAAVLLLTNDNVQNALFKGGVKAKDAVSGGVEKVKAKFQEAGQPAEATKDEN